MHFVLEELSAAKWQIIHLCKKLKKWQIAAAVSAYSKKECDYACRI